MEFKATFFAIIIVGILVSAIGVITNDWGIEYGSNITNDLSMYNKIGESSDYISGYQGKINPQTGETSTDPETITYRGVYSIISGIFRPFTIIAKMIDSLFETFGLPVYIKQGIMAMILASVVFYIVAIIFRMSKPSA